VVADALEIVRDLDCSDDEAKIARHRLLKCEEFDGCLLDFHLRSVEIGVTVDDQLRFLAVAGQQGFNGEIRSLLRR
jgi:hypothetical protein